MHAVPSVAKRVYIKISQSLYEIKRKRAVGLLCVIAAFACALLAACAAREAVYTGTAADWEAGWLAWKGGDYKTAISHWISSPFMEPFAIRQSRLYYWKIRAFEKLGRKEEAEMTAGLLAIRFPTDFYTFVLAYEGKYPRLSETARKARACTAYGQRWEEEVEKASSATGVPRYILFSLIRRESKFNEKAVSRSGAIGLMQLMPSTAEEAAARLKQAGADPYDPLQNVMMGAAHFAYLKTRFRGCMPLAVAAYNAGASPVSEWDTAKAADWIEWLEDIPYPQTREYVRSVFENMEIYSGGDEMSSGHVFFSSACTPPSRWGAVAMRGIN